MIYVADTHGLLWFLTEDPKLPEKARKVFEEVERGNGTVVIPSIVLAELLHICDGNDKLKDLFLEIIKKITLSTNYTIYDLNLNVILECRNLINVSEMHDKIIVATARILNSIVITKDKNIIDSKYVETIW